MYKVKHTRELKKFEKAICTIFSNPAEEFVSTSIGETHFYTNFSRANELLVQSLWPLLSFPVIVRSLVLLLYTRTKKIFSIEQQSRSLPGNGAKI